MANHQIPKSGPVPQHLHKFAQAHDQVAELVNKGLVRTSNDVVARRHPDGHITLHLSPNVTSQFVM